MDIIVCGIDGFIKKNIIANLYTIKEGKNRTRPNLSISNIYEDFRNQADVAIFLDERSLKDFLLTKQSYCFSKCIFLSSTLAPDTKIENQLFNSEIPALVYRVPMVIGKWDESNSMIVSLCRAIANNESAMVDSPDFVVSILFIEDLINELYDALEQQPHRCDAAEEARYCYFPVTYEETLGNIVCLLQSFRQLNNTKVLPDIPEGSFASKLCSMYLSYLPEKEMTYPLNINVDNRGVFVELVKTLNSGQVSINIARPGIIRGEHWHNSKWEIFIVVSGHGLIQERQIGSDIVHSFEVRGEEMRAVIMLPGYCHRIVNLEKDKDLVTVMYANEQFRSERPDTYFEIVE